MVVFRWMPGLAGLCFFAGGLSAQETDIAAFARTKETSVDVLVVGAGIAGLSAALEAGRGGATVTVVDMASVFGGHAMMAHGQLNLVATPAQEAQGVRDSPELAYRDFTAWGEDADPAWVRYYVEHSRGEIFEWLANLGVEFERVILQPGNSVPRVHQVRGRGPALVAPIYRECLKTPTISFRWNTRLDRLLRANDRVSGVGVTDLRTGQTTELRARAVVLATGGFQSNLEMVREAWPKDLPFPEHVLMGAGINANGAGLEIARANGAAVDRLDHQWNYLSGLPDPRAPGTRRGVFAAVPSVWVNAEGRRFMRENVSPKIGMPILLRQTGASYWAVFGSEALKSFEVSGADWSDGRKIERLILNNPALVKHGITLADLAGKTGLPAAELTAAVSRYNALVEKGVDDDFGRFGPDAAPAPKPISGPPYFAAQFFPITRKSMGGVVVDSGCRVLDREGRSIPGLFAAGEVTGLAGINGKAGLEGTFLAPSLLTGRVAGRTALIELGREPAAAPVNRERIEFLATKPAGSAPANRLCVSCHALPAQVAESRPGFWHFEKVHRVVIEKRYSCVDCHGEIAGAYLPDSATHRTDRAQQMLTCATCHR